MQAGRLDRRLTLQRGTTTSDAAGTPVTTWTDLATVWASYMPVSDAEKVAAAEVSATISARFRIRYGSTWADLSPADRVVFEGRVFDLWGVKEIGRREGLELTAAARAE